MIFLRRSILPQASIRNTWLFRYIPNNFRFAIVTRGIRTLSRRNIPSIDEQISQLDTKSKLVALKGLKEQFMREEQPDPKKLEETLILNCINTNQIDDDFWKLVKIFCKSIKDSEWHEYTDTLLKLLELCKSADQDEYKKNTLVVGSCLYRAKKVRLDPLNEIEYLDALSANNRVFDALRLWKSRVGRSDLEQLPDPSHWLVVGALYHLQAGLYPHAHNIATELHEKTDKLPTKLVIALLTFQCLQKNPNMDYIKYWVHLFVNKQFVEATDVDVTEDTEDHELLFGSFGEYSPFISSDDIHIVLAALIKANHWNEVTAVLNKAGQVGVQINNSHLDDSFISSATSAKHDDGYLQFFQSLENIGFHNWTVNTHAVGRYLYSLSLVDEITDQFILENLKNVVPHEFLPMVTSQIMEYTTPLYWPLNAETLTYLVRTKSNTNEEKIREYVKYYLLSDPTDIDKIDCRTFAKLINRNLVSIENATILAGTNSHKWMRLWRYLFLRRLQSDFDKSVAAKVFEIMKPLDTKHNAELLKLISATIDKSLKPQIKELQKKIKKNQK